MNFFIWILALSLTVTGGGADGKLKILALMPYNGKSHFYFAQVLFEELAIRGHDVTVLSHFPRKTPLTNYRDISMTSEISKGVHGVSMEDMSARSLYSKMMVFFDRGLYQVCHEGLAHLNVQKLLKSNEHYDLLITEMFNTDCFLGFVYKFGAPHVSIRTSPLSTWAVDRTGNPDNPSYIPGTTAGHPSRMNLLQRLDNLVYNVFYKIVYRIYDVYCEQVAMRYFGKDMPHLDDIARNASLFLVNSHFVHQYSKPLVPTVKEVAGLHVRNPKPLPKDLENWISGAKQGLLYLNLGSMLAASSMAAEKRQAFLEAFRQLEGYRVLMKWDDEESGVESLPGNVKLIKWAPQNDVLHHPNVKLFISHAGMLGTIEALHAGVPMVAIPFFGDQMTNARLLEERGLGIVLEYRDITFETVNRTLHRVLQPKYAKTAKELSDAFRDRPMPPLDEAVYWIEYVARHKDTAAVRLMRTPALDLHLYQYFLLDVLALIFFALLTFFWCLRQLGRTIYKLIARKHDESSKKSKKKKN
ncbi:UDP-glucuronosyltransferase 2C1 [Nasonia vitripennis]|uniref:UDP-glucuronosyltransferase n=1 Tax=Nasonia vitripennis TaxID=7425 RepID=A0A7M7H964_NASVI|nr:UDP-glucuronosyltransferase 2C1 [Nasonia vitripennis]XP_016838618.1 UDP-glucuronosyltransferase 2C1 [Nasonia vitripennis]XP_031780251.1 UDP-glucuronosyltransferase 2C1 [Nasonia vitripennis]XP_032453168.1 UDP-glucuronosyltransferase 2C1 [Nasonia vitripennis]